MGVLLLWLVLAYRVAGLEDHDGDQVEQHRKRAHREADVPNQRPALRPRRLQIA
ncbi:MAG: hypothetical protein ACJ76Z_02795 [Thermoleophilaceae bacterium]